MWKDIAALGVRTVLGQEVSRHPATAAEDIASPLPWVVPLVPPSQFLLPSLGYKMDSLLHFFIFSYSLLVDWEHLQAPS